MPVDNVLDIWQNAISHIKGKLNEQSFETWITPLRPLSLEENCLSVETPNQFFKDWLTDHYLDLIRTAMELVCGRKIDINFTIGQAAQAQGQAQPKARAARQVAAPEQINVSLLNPRFTFENFVIGSSNRFAQAAALAVSHSPAKSYNPFFIYGPSGMGKTHLMQAIVHEALKINKDLKVIYMPAETFMNQLIGAIQNRSTPKFRDTYRGVDILLIDDIHFITGKETTQEEFFHTFNALYDAHKQIVISSDRPPKEIDGLEKRLVTRFEWGLVADVQIPDFETRVAILRKKAALESIEVPGDVTFFIAEKIKSNIRELEGALIRVVAYASLTSTKIDLEIAKNILKDMVSIDQKNITIEIIQKKVAEYFDIRVSELRAKKRTRAIAYPRQIAMYLARDLTDYSLPEIGDQFGGRDHTTVLHACNKINNDLKKDQSIKNLLNKLIIEIRK